MIIPKKFLLSKSIIDRSFNIFPFYVSSCSKARRNNHYLNNNIDIHFDNAILKIGTAILLFWGVVTSNQSGKHQPLTWCNPRFNGRGDGSVYKRSFFRLKAIMTVFGGFTNSPIAKASIKTFNFHTYLGDYSNWSKGFFSLWPIMFNANIGLKAALSEGYE